MPRGTRKSFQDKIAELVRHFTHQGRVSLFDLRIIERFFTLQRKLKEGHIAWPEATIHEAFKQVVTENRARGAKANVTIEEVHKNIREYVYDSDPSRFKYEALSAVKLYGHRKQEALWLHALSVSDPNFKEEILFSLQEIAKLLDTLDEY